MGHKSGVELGRTPQGSEFFFLSFCMLVPQKHNFLLIINSLSFASFVVILACIMVPHSNTVVFGIGPTD